LRSKFILGVVATGLEASLSIAGHQRPLPPGIELAAYRIVQEATTNALKHAVGATALAWLLRAGAARSGPPQ
jgi:signal transduction histidine kinase